MNLRKYFLHFPFFRVCWMWPSVVALHICPTISAEGEITGNTLHSFGFAEKMRAKSYRFSSLCHFIHEHRTVCTVFWTHCECHTAITWCYRAGRRWRRRRRRCFNHKTWHFDGDDYYYWIEYINIIVMIITIMVYYRHWAPSMCALAFARNGRKSLTIAVIVMAVIIIICAMSF